MIRYGKALLVCCLFLLFISSLAQNKNKPATRKLQPVEEVEIDSNWESPDFFVPDIVPGKIGMIGLELLEPFNKEEALYKVFPGYHYPVYKNWAWSVWRATTYPASKSEDDGELYYFPGKRKNLTCFNNMRRYIDDSGRQNMLLSFSTVKLMSVEMMHCGHYSGADISVARFVKNGNKWMLKNFTMTLGCYGNWHHASPIDTIKLGAGNYGCIIDHEVNPPGGPGYASYHIYGLVNGQYKEILTMDDARCYMGMVSGWGTEIKRQNTSHLFDDLKLVTTGNFDGAMYDTCVKRYGDTTIDLPKEVYGQTEKAYSFSFRITKLYHFQEGHYKMVSNKKHVYRVINRKSS